MSRTYIPAALRQLVFDRASGRCEYCRFPQQMSFATFECEHVVAEKHGGTTTADNLALACPFCNRFKGTDLGSLDPDTGQLTRFFHPRNHQWSDHFRLEGARIVPLTPEGRVTVFIFSFSNSTTLIGSLSVNRSSSSACTRKVKVSSYSRCWGFLLQ